MGIPLDFPSQEHLYEAGDIVQITDIAHPWFPCILIVLEVKRWGLLAHLFVPTSNVLLETKPNIMPNRLTWNEVTKVGRAVVDTA